MADRELHIVTGAFGFSGKYIASKLLREGFKVRTLTGSPRRENPFGSLVEVQPFNFEDQDALIASMQGASVLYNTYWVRFNHANFTYAGAVVNTLKLFHAAKKAGVRRVVHLSITNPSEGSPLEYFRRKAEIEKALVESGLSYAILRPAVLFGKEDILVNNLVWFLRKYPVFPVFGDGLYRLQPIHAGDLARLAVAEGKATENAVVDAIGPETFTYRGLVEDLAEIVGHKARLLSLPSGLARLGAVAAGLFVHDTVITRDEVRALTSELLYSGAQPQGVTKLTDWAKRHAETIGLRYASELKRREDREKAYDSL